MVTAVVRQPTGCRKRRLKPEAPAKGALRWSFRNQPTAEVVDEQVVTAGHLGTPLSHQAAEKIGVEELQPRGMVAGDIQPFELPKGLEQLALEEHAERVQTLDLEP